MPRKKKTASAANPDRLEAADVLAKAEKLYPSLLAQRQALQAKLEQLDGMLAKLASVSGTVRSAPARAAAPA
ncbi:MAG: hypothetical protein K8H88_28560, partial [Sandaracinaceae bacterium]|nr:hypothetical protein [Sandaracinaceae bacterium]